MKKILIGILFAIIFFIGGIAFTIHTMQIDIIEETEEGVVIRIVVLDQWFNHYVEK
jgi:uncharacterized protein YxeA